MHEHPTARLTIDLEAIATNYAELAAVAAPALVAAVVKANAYGLGMLPVAARLRAAGCRSFFVATPDEGLALRAADAAARVFVLAGAGAAAVPALVGAGLVPVLNTLEEIHDWSTHAGGAPAALHLDTGMMRLGLDEREVERLCALPALLAALKLELVMTHLACADEPEHPQNAAQLALFETLCARLPAAPRSIGNSAGMLLGPAYRGDLVRPGIALYGGRPFARGPNPMRPVARLEARVLQIHVVQRDATVGYGATHVARAPSRLATVGAGYADGYPRALGGRGYAWAAGHAVPVVGRVSMDLTTLDVSDLPAGALAVGDWVDLVGGGVPLEEVARLAGTANYEVLTRVTARAQRHYQ